MVPATTPQKRDDANITRNSCSLRAPGTIRPREKCVFHYCKNMLRGRISPGLRDGEDVNDRDTWVTESAYRSASCGVKPRCTDLGQQ